MAEQPLFPLRTVLFPDGLLELKIFEARYLDLMSRCLRERADFIELHRLARGAARLAAGAQGDDAGWVANRWCEILPLPLEAKQRLMTLEDPVARLEVVDSLMRVRHQKQ